LSSMIAGGINFGEVHTAIPKAAILIIVVDLVCLLPFPIGVILAFPIWLLGVKAAFDLDFWEARFLVAINWMLNFIFRWAMMALFLAMILHGKGAVDDLIPVPRRSAPTKPDAPASPQEKAMDAIEKLGGSCEDDENAEDIRIIGVDLAQSGVTDADLV